MADPASPVARPSDLPAASCTCGGHGDHGDGNRSDNGIAGPAVLPSSDGVLLTDNRVLCRTDTELDALLESFASIARERYGAPAPTGFQSPLPVPSAAYHAALNSIASPPCGDSPVPDTWATVAPTPPPHPAVLETVRRFFRGDLANLGIAFSVWDWTRDEIHGLLLALFLRLGLVNTGLSLYKLYEFNQAVDRGYHDNPYHNFLHGVDVTYFLFHFLEEAEGAHGTCFDSRELAALLIAALAHDIGHPGKNNLFQINAKTPFFTMYGSKSVLERHSAVVCLDLLHAYGVLDTLDFPIGPTDTAENTPWIRALIEESILNTDMCFHYTLLEKIVAMTDKKFAADDEPISPTSLGTIQYAQTHDNTTVGSSAGANAGTSTNAGTAVSTPASGAHVTRDGPLQRLQQHMANLQSSPSGKSSVRSLSPGSRSQSPRRRCGNPHHHHNHLGQHYPHHQAGARCAAHHSTSSVNLLRPSSDAASDSACRASPSRALSDSASHNDSGDCCESPTPPSICVRSPPMPSHASPTTHEDEVGDGGGGGHGDGDDRENNADGEDPAHSRSHGSKGTSERVHFSDEMGLTSEPDEMGPGSQNHVVLRSSCPTSHQEDSYDEWYTHSDDMLQELGFEYTDAERRELINILLHAADISNATRPAHVCLRWSELVAEEFYDQGDEELRLGLPVSPNMERRMPVNQIGLEFNAYVAAPFFTALAELMPRFKGLVQILKSNKRYFLSRITAASPAIRSRQVSTSSDLPGSPTSSAANHAVLFSSTQPGGAGTAVRSHSESDALAPTATAPAAGLTVAATHDTPLSPFDGSSDAAAAAARAAARLGRRNSGHSSDNFSDPETSTITPITGANRGRKLSVAAGTLEVNDHLVPQLIRRHRQSRSLSHGRRKDVRQGKAAVCARRKDAPSTAPTAIVSAASSTPVLLSEDET